MACISECTKCGNRESHDCSSSGSFTSQIIKGKIELFCSNCVSEALIGYFGNKK